MRKIIGLMLLISLLTALAACATPAPTPSPAPSFTTINAKQGAALMQQEDKYFLVDVRTPDEFSQGHIEGALNIPDYELAAKAPMQITDKGAVIIVYCRSGRRSAAAAQGLASLGYTRVYDMGGIIDWPYPTVTG